MACRDLRWHGARPSAGEHVSSQDWPKSARNQPESSALARQAMARRRVRAVHRYRGLGARQGGMAKADLWGMCDGGDVRVDNVGVR
jgi:hypothetical protein